MIAKSKALKEAMLRFDTTGVPVGVNMLVKARVSIIPLLTPMRVRMDITAPCPLRRKACMAFVDGLVMVHDEGGRAPSVGELYWGPFLAWGHMHGRPMDTNQWGFVAPHVNDFDDFQGVGNEGLEVISRTMATLGIYIRPRFPLHPQFCGKATQAHERHNSWVKSQLNALRHGVVNLGPRFVERPPAEVNRELLQDGMTIKCVQCATC